MHKADPKRITWFLSLQRILHFPRYFMAPPMIALRSRGAGITDPDTRPSSAPLLQSEHTVPIRPSHFQALVQLKSHRGTSPVDGSGRVTSPRLPKQDGMKLPGYMQRPRDVWNSHLFMPSDQTLAGPSEHQAVTTLKASVHTDRQIMVPKSDHLGQVSEKSDHLAPIHPILQRQEISKPESGSLPRRIDTGTGETYWRQTPTPFLTEQSPSKPGTASRWQLPVPDREKTATPDPPQRSRPMVSTLHIDGSALGRWTVQYLERALGRPSTGMTGVDPRATVPRSRVAPF
jgi:hypothetical protein